MACHIRRETYQRMLIARAKCRAADTASHVWTSTPEAKETPLCPIGLNFWQLGNSYSTTFGFRALLGGAAGIFTDVFLLFGARRLSPG